MSIQLTPGPSWGFSSEGVARIAIERERQVVEEAYEAEHDDKHTGRQLMAAAICYLTRAFCISPTAPMLVRAVTSYWPWHSASWKPSDEPIRNLEKAGALIAAEIDRLWRMRVEKEKPPAPPVLVEEAALPAADLHPAGVADGAIEPVAAVGQDDGRAVEPNEKNVPQGASAYQMADGTWTTDAAAAMGGVLSSLPPVAMRPAGVPDGDDSPAAQERFQQALETFEGRNARGRSTGPEDE